MENNPSIVRWDMGQAATVEVRGKTEQRVASVVDRLRKAKDWLTYEELAVQTGTAYDVLLYITATAVELGVVEREERPDGPGRPRVYFRWVGKRGVMDADST